MAKSALPSLKAIIRLFHLFPTFGPAVLGDPSAGIGGALGYAQRNDLPGAVQEFFNVLVIEYTGFHPGNGSLWLDRGYPLKTYMAHGGIELAAWLANKFGGKAMNALSKILR